ncbi:translesion error-prone DNA polymerase V autoproteolytic subunit [Legionella israelensis]|uniref:SOS error prone mutagenesis protein UmuD (RumA) n=1 Tax=Legionella israelensis TaxID=454 RepID=A0A0W0WJR9_9GAMM|nr:translesion error-prone DNA polymerase V autoproteolytic subunit [Legionella israelensis]KTD32577.1 SOS error prone mutagenesis protein UmuD (RumA) [Legionella israelensis]QBR85219.1 translesion error-prone DNA polymerase V autoproteolytic subunit [Legionella israelensis]QBS09878.1 translesion error-prone DNA polymerase V autoproteolytic subunit [Legionella israelensis]QDP71323.1 translesion error-prone DNA polymerase V autoproteolytic subunit [Legionella israelensis]SCY18271.1 SOS response
MSTQHGGKRAGAGRPKGGGLYGEATKPIRVPLSRLNEVKNLLQQKEREIYQRPLYTSKVQAGFPSPADHYIETCLDLNSHLIAHPASTFFVIALGDSMSGAGIQSGDMLIVDKSLEATHGKIIIAAIDGELTVKRLANRGGRVQLLPENSSYQPIDITEEQELVIWGVVTHVIHQMS